MKLEWKLLMVETWEMRFFTSHNRALEHKLGHMFLLGTLILEYLLFRTFAPKSAGEICLQIKDSLSHSLYTVSTVLSCVYNYTRMSITDTLYIRKYTSNITLTVYEEAYIHTVNIFV